jgi:hypothetical protein
MRVVVTGMVATYPVGGVAWDYLQYVEGFRRLGCDVFYLEDTGQWFYDPPAGTFFVDGTMNAQHLARTMAELVPECADAWSLRGPDDVVHGRDAAHVRRICDGADLFLNVSGASRLRDEYRRARRLAFIDTDPLYTQARAAAVDAGTVDPQMIDAVETMRRHEVWFTLGEHIGAPDCAVPTVGLPWRPTRQPIVLERWPTTPAPDGRFTTVMSWKIEPSPPIIAGHVYGGKDVEFERFMALPSHTPERLEVAIAGVAPRARIEAAGWHVVDAQSVSRTTADHRDYALRSRGEVSTPRTRTSHRGAAGSARVARRTSPPDAPSSSRTRASPRIFPSAPACTRSRRSPRPRRPSQRSAPTTAPPAATHARSPRSASGPRRCANG